MKTEDCASKGRCLLLNVRLSTRYHLSRARFFKLSCILLMTWSILFLALGASLLGHSQYFLAFGVPAAAVFSPAFFIVARDCLESFKLHALLARRFQELEKQMAGKPQLSESEYDEFRMERISIESKAPFRLRLLRLICQCQLLKEQERRKENLAKIPVWRRLLAHFSSQTKYARTIAI